MDHEALLKKLRYKSGPASVLNAPVGYSLGIGTEADSPLVFLLLYVHNAEEANEWLPRTVPALAEDAVFWIAYPKQSSKVKTDLNRDSLWLLVQNRTSYRAVSNVAIDETWSAVRFRHADKVQSK
ncbi:hypothetical protein ACFFNY_17710 [Paenibacillus hodogayensis]|uniref:Uncharacterized protein n=1 Tax=Paenibacillus hodogayensis TaxID=279208 RepID=A0ABV5VYM6_9BACL